MRIPHAGDIQRDGYPERDHEQSDEHKVQSPAGLQRNRLGTIDILIELDPFWRDLENPGEHQRYEKTSNDNDDAKNSDVDESQQGLHLASQLPVDPMTPTRDLTLNQETNEATSDEDDDADNSDEGGSQLGLHFASQLPVDPVTPNPSLTQNQERNKRRNKKKKEEQRSETKKFD